MRVGPRRLGVNHGREVADRLRELAQVQQSKPEIEMRLRIGRVQAQRITPCGGGGRIVLLKQRQPAPTLRDNLIFRRQINRPPGLQHSFVQSIALRQVPSHIVFEPRVVGITLERLLQPLPRLLRMPGKFQRHKPNRGLAAPRVMFQDIQESVGSIPFTINGGGDG